MLQRIRVLSPAESGTNNSLTTSQWCTGPSAVALKMDRHWVNGALANYISSFAGQSDRGAVSQWLIQNRRIEIVLVHSGQ
jgi:hypothetical protein